MATQSNLKSLMEQRSVYLAKRQWAELDQEAKYLGITVSEYMRRFIDVLREERRKLASS